MFRQYQMLPQGQQGTTDASELPAGNESCAGEDAEVRSISAVPSWQSSRDLPGKVVALVQDSEQDSGGMLPLQDKTAVALEPGPVSWEGKSILGAEGGVGIPSSSNQLLADACVEIDPTNVLISNRAAPIEESGLEDPMA